VYTSCFWGNWGWFIIEPGDSNEGSRLFQAAVHMVTGLCVNGKSCDCFVFSLLVSLFFFPVVCQCYLVINPYTIYVYNMYIICYIYLYDLILLCLKIPLESSWLHHLASSGLPAMPTWKVQEQLGDLSILGSRRTTNLDRMWWDMYTCDVVCIYIYILN